MPREIDRVQTLDKEKKMETENAQQTNMTLVLGGMGNFADYARDAATGIWGGGR
jgi:hypothetical protein